MRVYYYSFLCSLVITIITLSLNFRNVFSKSDVDVNYQFTLAVPEEFDSGFTGRAFLMGTTNSQNEPNFRVALSVEAIQGLRRYACALEVFLGDVRVWNSGHYSKAFVKNKCVLELSEDGDLRLKGPKGSVCWKTGTSGQGVKRLQIRNNGNLVLADGLNRIKWQSFNFPTDVILLGQKLNVATRLTSFPINSTSYYSLEIEKKKIALYLNSGNSNYSYWELKPSNDRNITFIKLGTKGLEIFNEKEKKIAQIPCPVFEPLRFLALSNKTGNLGLYFYSPSKSRFGTCFQALNSTCDLPLACKPYGFCTFSNSCSCIRVGLDSDCGGGLPGEFCPKEKNEVETVELLDVISVLKSGSSWVNVSKEECVELCLDDCQCTSASFSYALDRPTTLCSLYGLVEGLKQVDPGSGMSYIVKVSKGVHKAHGRPNVKKWVLILVGVIDGLVILLVFGGLGYYLVRKERSRLLTDDAN